MQYITWTPHPRARLLGAFAPALSLGHMNASRISHFYPQTWPAGSLPRHSKSCPPWIISQLPRHLRDSLNQCNQLRLHLGALFAVDCVMIILSRAVLRE